MKKYPQLILALIISISLLADRDTHAEGGFKTPTEGGTASGKAGGHIAFIDDASAVKHNPANLVSIENPVVQESIEILYLSREFTSLAGMVDEQPNHWIIVPHIFAALPIESQPDMVFGIGIYTDHGLASNWKKDGPLRYFAPYSADNQAFNINPTLAIRINDKLSIALGGSLLHAELALHQFYPWMPGVLPDGEMHFEADGQGWGKNIAMTYEITPNQRLALTYRTPIKVDYDGSFEINNIPAGYPALPRSDFYTDIEYPGSVSLGYGININKDLQLGIDVRWVECSTVDSLPIDVGANNMPLFGGQQELVQRWQDTWDMGLGVDWKMNSEWTLRAGYSFYERPTINEYWSPLLTEYDRHTFSIGAGYTHNQHRLDLGLSYAYYEPLKITDNHNPAFNGNYKASLIMQNISYTYSF